MHIGSFQVRLRQGVPFARRTPLLPFSFLMATSRSKPTRDPVLVQLFRRTGHSYEDGIAFLLARFRDSLVRADARQAASSTAPARRLTPVKRAGDPSRKTKVR